MSTVLDCVWVLSRHALAACHAAPSGHGLWNSWVLCSASKIVTTFHLAMAGNIDHREMVQNRFNTSFYILSSAAQLWCVLSYSLLCDLHVRFENALPWNVLTVRHSGNFHSNTCTRSRTTIIPSLVSIRYILSKLWTHSLNSPNRDNPGQKYMVHLENLLCFHYRPLFDDKSGSFSQTWPSPLPPIQCCFTGDTLGKLIQHCMGGRGGEMGKLSKKAKCTITFGQDCRLNHHFRHGAHSVYKIYSVFKLFEIAVYFAHFDFIEITTPVMFKSWFPT